MMNIYGSFQVVKTHPFSFGRSGFVEPDVLILDEPIAQLDPKHADLIYGILKDLNKRLGKTIIVMNIIQST